MDFEWDSQKADINAKKHGAPFEEASAVFGDYLSVTYPDLGHSIQEEPYQKLFCNIKKLPEPDGFCKPVRNVCYFDMDGV